ncbi:DNA polymerase III subunit beta [Akkermansiaceae bacterium]|nr:DNA polymerase III subunit beta [Akkermansiaceae bacterium]
MSKQSILAKDLREMITGFRKIVPRQSETLRDVKVDFAQGTITATDGSAFLSYQLGKATPDGRTYLLSFDSLIHFAKGLPARQKILIEAQDGIANLTTENRKCVAKPLRPDDPFATPPKFVGKTQPVTPEDRSAILRALTCASTDDTRYILRGVFLEHEGTTPQVVGTDGRCLYHEPLRSMEIPKPFILPASPLLSWKGFEHEWQLKVSRSKKEPTMLQLTAGPWTFTTPAIDGNYPNWRQVVPEARTRPTRLTLGKDDIATLREMKGESIGFLSKPDEVRFVTFDKEANKWNTHQAKDSTCQGNCQVFIDPKFLKRALDTEVHEACMAEELDPILFRGKGQLIVMPLRVTGPPIPDKDPKPKQKEPPKPVAPPQPKPMQSNTPNQNKSTPSELALESLKTLKTQLRESIGLVDQAMRNLRDAQANQRATQKDIKTIRGTLQSLKKVAFPN